MSLAKNNSETMQQPTTGPYNLWPLYGLALLSIRFMQGFIYWGGGSRRFIYAPSKLMPSSHTWMANKFQTAMPGALLGMDHVVSYMLQHFWLLYTSIILFSLAELLVGLALMVGFLTRLSALISMGFAVLLMLLFGWQRATCIDEWTMAACNLAMGATLFLAGGKAYSVDSLLLTRNPALAQNKWFRLAGGALPLDFPEKTLRHLGLGVFAFVAAFNVITYSHYRGSVITPFHSGPVNPSRHHFSLDHAMADQQGNVRFHIYLDQGTPEAAAHIVKITLLDPQHNPVMQWNAEALSALPASVITNDYAYNQFMIEPFGIRALMGAKATITLPCPQDKNCTAAKWLRVTNVDGKSFDTTLNR